MTKKPEDRILVAIRTRPAEFHVVGASQGYVPCRADLGLGTAGQRLVRENPGVRASCGYGALAAGPHGVEAAPGAVDKMAADRGRRARKHPLN